MPQRILGIDIGSWSVKAVRLETTFRGYNVEAVREVVLPPEQEGISKRERQVAALKALLDTDLKADITVAAFPADHAAIRFVNLPFSDARRVEQTIGGELEDTLPFDLDEAVFDHELMAKDSSGSTSLCVAARRDKVRETIELLNEAGLDPRFLGVDVVDLFTLYSHFLHDDASRAEAPTEPAEPATSFISETAAVLATAQPDARLIVDIGHERTLVCAAFDGGVAHVRVLRAGGRDVTQAIAKAYGLSFLDAEAGKHEDALVVSGRHPAPTDAAQRMSDVVAQGLEPLVQELRRTIQSIRKERRVRLVRIDVVGGGARIRNLPNWLGEQLALATASGVAVEQMVEPQVDVGRRGAFAGALALALRAAGAQRVLRLDLRVQEFAYAGQLQHLKSRLPFMGAAAALLLLLFAGYTLVEYQVSSSREKAIDAQFCKITKEVVGREICEPTVALSVIQQPTSELGNFKLPERTAVRVAAELSHLLPKELEVLIEELDITPEKARLSGTTKSFDAVDQIVTAYSAEPCLSEIKKGKLRKSSDGTQVEFQLTMKLGCSR